MDKTIQKFKAMGDKNRFRILMMLLIRPLCVCELLAVLNIKGGTLSAHLKILKNAELISQEKDGRWIVYSLSTEDTKIFLINIRKELFDISKITGDEKIITNISRDICSNFS